MMFSELNSAQNQMLDLLREMVQRGCAPDGFPAVMPMWRVQAGVELDGDRDEAVALRAAVARLQLKDKVTAGIVIRLAAGYPCQADEWILVGNALDDLDTWVEQELDRG